MSRKIVSLMLVICVILSVGIIASAEAVGVEPAVPPTGIDAPIKISDAKCVGRTVTVEYTFDVKTKFDETKDVTVLFYSPVGPDNDKKYITYKNGTKEDSAIYYADQVKYDGTNKLVFSIPSTVKEGTNYNVLVGGTDVDYPGLYKGVNVPKAFIYGDIDENGKINSTDALIVAKYAADIRDVSTNDTIFNAEKSYLVDAADVDTNDKVNVTDALNIAKYAVEDVEARKMIDALNGVTE